MAEEGRTEPEDKPEPKKFNPLEVKCAHLAPPVKVRFHEEKPMYCAYDGSCRLQHFSGDSRVCKAELDPSTYKRNPKTEQKP